MRARPAAHAKSRDPRARAPRRWRVPPGPGWSRILLGILRVDSSLIPFGALVVDPAQDLVDSLAGHDARVDLELEAGNLADPHLTTHDTPEMRGGLVQCFGRVLGERRGRVGSDGRTEGRVIDRC